MARILVRHSKRGSGKAERRIILAGVAAAVILVVAGYLLRFQPSAAPRATQSVMYATVRLNAPFDPSFAGEMVAARAGLFAREGLSVNLKPGSADTDAIRQVNDNAGEIGVAKAESMLLARAKGAPVVAFAAAYVESPVALYTLEKSAIRTPSQLVGKRIGYRPGEDTSIIYQAMMAKLLLSRSTVREVKVGADMTPLLNGEIDVWPGHAGVEAYTLKQAGIAYNVINPDSYGVHVPGTVYFTAESTIRENPQLIRRFLRAVIAGWELTYADYAASIPLIASFDTDRLTPDLIRFRLEQQRALLRPLGARFGEFDAKHWQSLQDILLQQRLLKEPLDLSTALTYDFLRDAYRRSGTLEQ
jgi:ABC-type nitrate/sulfonate/bicarbonate transport system substrate-binding protein